MKKSTKESADSPVITEKPLPEYNFLREKVSDALVRLFSGVDITLHGTENFQKINGPVVFALAPHNGHTDHPVLLRALKKADKQLKRKVFILSLAGYWDKPIVKQTSQWVIRNMPFSRKRGAQQDQDRKIIAGHITNGDIPIVWVEGTRTNHGTPMKDRSIGTAAIHIAMDTGAQIIPIYVGGAADMMPPGSKWFKTRRKRFFGKKFKVSVVIGKPIVLDEVLPAEYKSVSDRKRVPYLRTVREKLHDFYIQEEKKHLNK